jgi:hypothetical protein
MSRFGGQPPISRLFIDVSLGPTNNIGNHVVANFIYKGEAMPEKLHPAS